MVDLDDNFGQTDMAPDVYISRRECLDDRQMFQSISFPGELWSMLEHLNGIVCCTNSDTGLLTFYVRRGGGGT